MSRVARAGTRIVLCVFLTTRAEPAVFAATGETPPAVNRVVVLDGKADARRVPDSPSLRSFTNAIMFEAWIKVASFYETPGSDNSIPRKHLTANWDFDDGTGRDISAHGNDARFEAAARAMEEDRSTISRTAFTPAAEAMGHVLLVGTPTNGAGGGPTGVELPDGSRVRISRALGVRANGVVFEGHGIPPHLFCAPTIAGLRSGGDAALELGRDWLLSDRPVPDRSMRLRRTLVMAGEKSDGADTAESAAQGSAHEAEPAVIRDLRVQLPVGWECAARRGDAVKSVPHGLERPLFEWVASNTNVVFEGLQDTPNPARRSPVISLYFYPQAEKADVLKIIEKEALYSWNIPIYFGESDEFVVVTSPGLVNGGVFTAEARRALQPMWKVLRQFLPNKENSRVDELVEDHSSE